VMGVACTGSQVETRCSCVCCMYWLPGRDQVQWCVFHVLVLKYRPSAVCVYWFSSRGPENFCVLHVHCVACHKLRPGAASQPVCSLLVITNNQQNMNPWRNGVMLKTWWRKGVNKHSVWPWQKPSTERSVMSDLSRHGCASI